MSQDTLSQYADVVVVNSAKIALEIALTLKQQPQHTQRDAFAGSRETGHFYLYRLDKFPDTVFECVASPDGDAITSLYKNHRIFGSAGELMRARGQLIAAISEKVGLSAESIGIDDPGRGRALSLNELSTGQLIDTLAERMGQSILVTDSHSAVASS